MVNDNPGILLEEILDLKNKTIMDLRNILGYTANRTVKDRIIKFKKKKGRLSTFIKYCNALDTDIRFIVFNDDNSFEKDNPAIILEKIREQKNLNKGEMAKKLDKEIYTSTYHSFNRKGCNIDLLIETFNMLDYKVKFKAVLNEKQRVD